VSDIGFHGLAAAVAGLAFLALAGALALTMILVVVVRAARRRPLGSPGLAGAGVATGLWALVGTVALVAAETSPASSDDSLAFWGTAGLVVPVLVAVAVTVLGGRPRGDDLRG